MTDLLNMLIAFRATAAVGSSAHAQSGHAIRDVRRAIKARTEAGRLAALSRAHASFRIAKRNA